MASRTEFPEKEQDSSIESSYSSKYPSSIKKFDTSTSKSSTSPDNYEHDDPLRAQPPGPSKLEGVDLSKYRRPELVAAFDHLTSWTHPLKLLTLPAMKIGWRSLMAPSPRYLTLGGILSELQGTETFHNVRELPKQPAEGARVQSYAERPTLFVRMLHFFFVGIPLAIFIGLLYGILNTLNSYMKDVRNIIQISSTMFMDAKNDIQYFKKHPDKRPTKNETTEIFLNQVVHPYSSALVNKKLPWIFAFMRPPVKMVVNSLSSFIVRRAINNLDYYGRHLQNFHPFADSRQKEVMK